MTEPQPAPDKLVVLQSNYLPWRGYFDLVHDADLFVFYDDVQYTKNDWRNRNKVKTQHGCEWLTIPAGADENRLICEVQLAGPGWQRKHWQTLLQLYGKAPHFGCYRAVFEDVYLGRNWTNLSELNQHLIRRISHELLGLQTRFADSRDYNLTGRKQDRLIELVTKTRARTYISGPAAKDYIDPSRFDAIGVQLVWKDYTGYPEYVQRHPPFRSDVSIVDLLFNVGADAPAYIWGWRRADVDERTDNVSTPSK